MIDNNYDKSDNSDILCKKKCRRNKKLYFENERNEIYNNLINFINNTKDSELLFLVDLYDNKELNKYIDDNIDNIKKYYRCSSWGYFVSLGNNQPTDNITLMKSILKDHGCDIYRKDITTEKNNIKKRYTTIRLIFN
ncbi:MAG: hypothetical protein K2P52_02380 [Campylobacterales bacterium]|nr:hypothetical protein [Campylobacterales bacterium]